MAGEAFLFPIILSMEQSAIGDMALEIRIVFDIRRNQEQNDAGAMYDGSHELEFQCRPLVVVSRPSWYLIYTKIERS